MTTTTANPRSLCLRDHEVRRLLEHGRVLVVREVKLSDEYTRGCDPGLALLSGNHAAHLRDGIGLVWWPYAGSPEVPMPPDKVAEYSPFGPVGTRLLGKEKFGVDTNGSRQWVVYGDMARGPDCSDKISHADAVRRGTLVNGFDWRSAATMPREFVRLHAENAGVAVKRCRDLSSTNMEQAGIPDHGYEEFIGRHHKAAWERNAWLWLCDARRVD